LADGYMPRCFRGRTIMKRTISEDQVIPAAAGDDAGRAGAGGDADGAYRGLRLRERVCAS
jgi:hypothetical protein